MDPTFSELSDRVTDQIDGRSVACAESFSAGVIAQTLAAGESASDWFCGGVVAYQERVKHAVLGVEAEQVVSDAAAIEMAAGVAKLLDADVGIATTGVAGPDDQDGIPAGTVVIGWAAGDTTGSETFHFDGSDPEAVVKEGARVALERLCALLAD